MALAVVASWPQSLQTCDPAAWHGEAPRRAQRCGGGRAGLPPPAGLPALCNLSARLFLLTASAGPPPLTTGPTCAHSCSRSTQRGGQPPDISPQTEPLLESCSQLMGRSRGIFPIAQKIKAQAAQLEAKAVRGLCGNAADELCVSQGLLREQAQLPAVQSAVALGMPSCSRQGFFSEQHICTGKQCFLYLIFSIITVLWISFLS